MKQRLKRDTSLTRLERLSIAVSIGSLAWNYAQKAHAWHLNRVEGEKFTLTIEDDDDLWRPIERWLTEELRSTDTHHMTVQSFEDEERLFEFYKDDRERRLTLEGHSIVVKRVDSRAEWMSNKTPGDTTVIVGSPLTDKFVFTAESELARDALMRKLNGFLDERKRGPFFYRQRPWGGFRRMDNKVHRPLDTIILPGDMADRLVADMQQFLESEKEYAVRGIPWHRGYLFYGPPGTGKTSLIQAVCGHVGVNVYFVSLSSVKSDQALFNLMESIDDGDALIIEDVDVYQSAHERNGQGASDDHLTLDGLLQVTDGAFTPHGAMIFMTTNRVETLDDALIRPGRCDFKEELGFLDQDQLDRIVARFVGEYYVTLDRAKVTPADVVGALKDTMFLPVADQLEAIRRVVS